LDWAREREVGRAALEGKERREAGPGREREGPGRKRVRFSFKFLFLFFFSKLF
jgi:hypothetical protein